MKTNSTDRESEPFKKDKDSLHDTSDYTVRGLDTGWAWAVLFASFGVFCILGGKMYAVGIIHAALLERYRESLSLTSWAGALHTALFSLGGPLASAVIDRFSCRTALILSGIFFVIGYMGTAFAQSIETAILTCGILAGTGGAFGYTTAMVVVGFNFKKKRNLALGIAVSGVGAGVFILAPLMQLSRDYYGPVGFFIILAAIAANIITFGCMCFPSKLEKYTQLHRRYETRKLSASRFSCASLKVYLRVLCNKGVICLCVCMFCFCLGTILIYVHLPTFIVSKGFSAFQAAFLVSLSGILSLIGRILTGIVANLNRINETYLYSGSFGIVSVACFIYPFSSDYFVAHVIFVVLFGLFFGCCYVIMTAVTLPFVGIHYISAAIGLQLFFGGIGSIVGPVLAGFLVDAGGSYEQSIVIAASCILLSAISSAATLCFQQSNIDVLIVDKTIEMVDSRQNRHGRKDRQMTHKLNSSAL